ncbi:MAG TPA: hypothetical protein VMN38_03290 [Sphingomicrobium sp.]|nr:hypothetical protein [Sphingomicrobium sp.]
MAKAKQKKKSAKAVKPKPRAKPASAAATGTRRTKVAKAARRVSNKAGKLAANPLVAEVVAATLVAAAAALKSPKKAREMAAAAAEDLESASKEVSARGSAFWQLALDIARRSVDSLGGDDAVVKAKAKPKKKAKK